MDFNFESNYSIDNYFSNRIKVSSYDISRYFERKDANILINKSTKDLWKLSQDESGDLVIERLFKGEQ